MKKQVLILTGPGGAGKTTIAELLEKEHGYIFVDGDNLDTEFFPKGGQWKLKNIKKLRKAHDKILEEVKNKFDHGKNNVVVDYIIFGDYLNFINKFKKEFGDNLIIKILFPSKDEMIKRDKERECWMTGVKRIQEVRKEFENIKTRIYAEAAFGDRPYIDSSNKTPEETVKIIINS